MTMKIDLNCDMGESFGNYKLGCDYEVMDEISSANIACGFHAGDFMVLDKTVKWAVEKNVGIGCHPGFPDLQGFGRTWNFPRKKLKIFAHISLGQCMRSLKNMAERYSISNHTATFTL